ncbi:hypothetical protein SLE2022_004960 [Rubroshorea leprosula]
MSSRGGGGSRGGRRQEYGRGQSQSPGQSASSGGGGGGGRGGGRGRGRGGDGGVGAGRGRGVPGFPSPGFTQPPPTVSVPVTPPVTESPSSSSGSSHPSVPSGSSFNVGDLSLQMTQQLALEPRPATEPSPSSSKAVRVALRPGYGTLGGKCMVRANHFIVQLADKDLHHYDVSISPEVTSKKVNRDIMAQLVEMYKESHLGRRTPAYDGMKSLYTAGALPFESKQFVVKLTENDRQAGSSSGSSRRERKFTVTIKLASKPDLHFLQQFLRGRHSDSPQDAIQALDVVLRAPPMQRENCIVVGRSIFSKDIGSEGELGGGVQYWLGYYQSLRPTQMGLSLNIDVSARSFYEPILVTEFIAKYFNLRSLSGTLSDQDRIKARRALRGIKVELTHREYVRSYKIADISREPTRQLTFTDDRGRRISVVQYFREKYNIGLRYTDLPALQVGTEAKPIYLPMEVCKIVRGQRYTKKLNERQVTALLRATCQRPRDRENNIRGVVRYNEFNRNSLLKEFGVQVGVEPTTVKARVLPPPLLKYHETGREREVNPSMGQWNMINKKMVNGGRVDSWTCVNFSSSVDQRLQSEFCKQLVEMCRSKGMEINPRPVVPMRSFRSGQIEMALTEIHNQARNLQLLIIILPDVTGSYGKIKRICETELGIVSQCCQPRQVAKLSKQYMENVSLKINVKVGGRNTVLNDAIQRRIPNVSDRPTIIFGADVTHPQPGEDSSPSIAAVVASMDWPEVTKYRGLVSAQPHREEIIQDLYKTVQDSQRGIVHGGMIRELFRAFRMSTGQKPERIIFYRDGVSEGQFSQVLLHEMDAIRKACSSLEEGYLPPVTFIVVQKRHHTRLFPLEHNSRDQTDRSGNIRPGTVVDTDICHPTEFDFYLNSHAGIQGTSRPTHYHVLYDENRFTADALQVLTNNLCYTYARCTRSVSIVPPAYYAHLAAFRARYYIEGESSDATSSGESKTTKEKTKEVRQLPIIKDNVKDVMFYC